VTGSKGALSRPVLALAGPTAVGKTNVALFLAEQLNGEIVSVDSMQVYRGLDIGTAKPSKEERERVPHHLLDVVELTHPFDAAQFVTLARAAIQQIHSRNRVPILCGGTGLYFKALLYGLGTAPGGSVALRAQLEATPISDLLSELAKRDPLTYAQIDRQNSRRIIRALEVIRLTGQAYSAQRADWFPARRQEAQFELVGLKRSTEDLRRRIDARVETMFRQGLIEETRHLLKNGLESNRTALQALGYRQVVEFFKGERSLPETITLVKTRTWQFAKRQMTWFRRQLPMRWVEIQPGESAGESAEQVRRMM
jgi:tRNA dimethylallyltransferase